MKNNIDYRLPEYRQEGFKWFYRFMCETEDCSPDIAVETYMANKYDWAYERRCSMALFHGAAYEGSTEVILSDKFPTISPDVIDDIIKFHDANFTDGLNPSQPIKRLTRSPDAKHRWYQPAFSKFIKSVGESIKPYGTLGEAIKAQTTSATPETRYTQLQNWCFKNWYQWGRMAHWCFSEALHRFVRLNIMPPTMEFEHGEGIRQGFAFSIGLDDLVKHATTLDCVWLEGEAWQFLQKFREAHPQLKNINRFTLETCFCNYKRQHKGSRYSGCYIDEQYDALIQMRKDWPEYRLLADAYIEARQAVIPESLLYELHKDDSPNAHVKSWNGALRDYGRMPRVEAYFNNQPQRWTDLKNMPFAKSGSDLTTLMDTT